MAKDRQREKFVAEIQRLKTAVDATKSEYLRRDYEKAIRRMEQDLMEYDSYKRMRS